MPDRFRFRIENAWPSGRTVDLDLCMVIFFDSFDIGCLAEIVSHSLDTGGMTPNPGLEPAAEIPAAGNGREVVESSEQLLSSQALNDSESKRCTANSAP